MKRFPTSLLSVLALICGTFLAMGLSSCGSSSDAADGSSDSDTGGMSADAVREQLVGPTWVLSSVGGRQNINFGENQTAVTLQFMEGGTFTGNTGCNVVNGAYELQDGLRISFSNPLSTLRACDDAPHEQTLLEAINTADNLSFRRDGEQLSLNKARMAPLATFTRL